MMNSSIDDDDVVFLFLLGRQRFLTKMMRDSKLAYYACLFILLHVHTTMSISLK